MFANVLQSVLFHETCVILIDSMQLLNRRSQMNSRTDAILSSTSIPTLRSECSLATPFRGGAAAIP